MLSLNIVYGLEVLLPFLTSFFPVDHCNEKHLGMNEQVTE